MKFKDKLLAASRKNNSWLCIGLDPEPLKMPLGISRDVSGIEKFLKTIIDATHDLVCCYKPNSAFYENLGETGLWLLHEIIGCVPDEIPIILDAKRGDIGNTSKMYAKAAFDELGADAITVSPYLGYDSIAPFLDYPDKGIFILCLTSNPSAADFQKRIITSADGRLMPLYEHVAEMARQWNQQGNIGLVVGATNHLELARVRQITGDETPLLIPGVGAQGGDLES